MKIIEFLGLNFILGAAIVLVVFVYIVSLINKRKKNKFLHNDMKG
jgi:hypothetical protein